MLASNSGLFYIFKAFTILSVHLKLKRLNKTKYEQLYILYRNVTHKAVIGYRFLFSMYLKAKPDWSLHCTGNDSAFIMSKGYTLTCPRQRRSMGWGDARARRRRRINGQSTGRTAPRPPLHLLAAGQIPASGVGADSLGGGHNTGLVLGAGNPRYTADPLYSDACNPHYNSGAGL